jgi:hydroxymethylbilane synthase
MATTLRLRLGTRASALARWQANWVAARLAATGIEIELVPITTRGDTSQQDPIGNIGSPGVFTKELQRALLEGRIDLAVHSLKDLPTDVVEGLTLAAVPERESPRDVLVNRAGEHLAQLPEQARIGTGSLRRRAQLLHARPDLQMRDIRGNVDTRLRKLEQGEYDALVLAEAGLRRLDLAQHITEILAPETMLPAVGQGALGIEARANEAATLASLAALDDRPTHQAVLAERSLLEHLRGGCLAPIGAWGRHGDDGQLHLSAVVLSPDGKQRLIASAAAPPDEAVDLGCRVANELIALGAAELIGAARVDR